LSGGPDLGGGSVAERLKVFREQKDKFRSAIINEPRGSDVLVGALLVEPRDTSCVTGVIFFNNVGYLGMCGHGTIGLVVTLAHLGRIKPGEHRLETPVGVISATLHEDGSVSVANVPSFRKAKGVTIDVPGIGKVTGDVAWGGNWFFLVEEIGIPLTAKHAADLTVVTQRIREAINRAGFPEVDHIKAYDRSPCGTGTSAKLACLAADGKLEEGQPWVQESLIGSLFTASYRWHDRAAGTSMPTITGTAFVTSEATLLLDDNDPFCWGIR
ncbi:MAG: hydroxyproline-2-epimerase, partial [Verrucomicrobia bacterium]